MSGMIRRPKEIGSCVKKMKGNAKQTFSVEQHLAPASEEMDEQGYVQDPLKLFAEYSVFKTTILEVNGNQKDFVYSNIPIAELSTITKRTNAMTERIMDAECKTESTNEEENMTCKGTSPAYTTMLKIGNFKNKTPAQVLSESMDNLEALKGTATWLEKKVKELGDKPDKFGNKAQYDAVMDAIRIAQNNELDSSQVKKNAIQGYKIYEAQVRPLLRKTRNDGRNFVYGMKVCCYPGKANPYEVTISNYWAVCKGVEPQKNSIVDFKKMTVNLSESIWDNMVDQMNNIKDIFIRCYGKYEAERAEMSYQEIIGDRGSKIRTA